MNAPALLQEGDQAIDRAGPERVAADQQRMEAEDDPEPLVANILGDEPVDAAMAAEPYEIPGDARHVDDRAEGSVAKPFESDPVDRFAAAHEALKPLDVIGIETRHLGAHRRLVAAHVEDGAALKADLIERRHRPKLDVVGHPAPAERPELLEQERRGHDRRSQVEGEAVLMKHARPAAWAAEFFDDGHPVAPCAEPDRRRETAEPAANHDRSGTGARRAGNRLRTIKRQHKLTLAVSISLDQGKMRRAAAGRLRDSKSEAKPRSRRCSRGRRLVGLGR